MPDRTRLAPSPTGALHLGNARTFLINWAIARQRGWKVILRIEDLDGPRIKPDAAEHIIDTLRWLGLDWDQGPHTQLADLAPYRAAIDRLDAARLVYPCRCTRSEIASAQSAPHAEQRELRYPGTCRPEYVSSSALNVARYECETQDFALRLRVPDEPITFHDGFAGPQTFNVQHEVGDFIIAAKAGLPAYQLAVVVDDARQGVTQVVRGDDLIPSTPRQILLYRLLNLGPPPQYTHLPLVLGPDGRRLAKRHGDTRIAHYRQAGATPRRITGLLAEWSGLGPRREMTADQFAERFDLKCLPRGPVTFTMEDERWLREAHLTRRPP